MKNSGCYGIQIIFKNFEGAIHFRLNQAKRKVDFEWMN